MGAASTSRRETEVIPKPAQRPPREQAVRQAKHEHWAGAKLAALGKTAPLLVRDNAPWHISHTVRDWILTHNLQVKRDGKGVRILSCFLPILSPWLSPIEPTWIHGQHKIVEPARLFTARQIEDRVCHALSCSHEEHLSVSENVA